MSVIDNEGTAHVSLSKYRRVKITLCLVLLEVGTGLEYEDCLRFEVTIRNSTITPGIYINTCLLHG